MLSGGRCASEHLAVQGAGRCLGDQQPAQQEDDAQASKYQSYQVLDNCKYMLHPNIKVIRSESTASLVWLFQIAKLLRGWIGGHCGFSVHSTHSENCPSIQIGKSLSFRHPDHTPIPVMWAHHEKLVIIDQV